MRDQLYGIKVCTRLAGDEAPGVTVRWPGELGYLSPADARSLGADLILAANASEAQWDATRAHELQAAGAADTPQ